MLALPGLAARRDGVLVGIVTFERAGPRVELAALAVRRDQRNRGIAAALVEAVADAARRAGAGELWLVTTNDNLDALRLYQRHSFRLAELRPDALDAARRETSPGTLRSSATTASRCTTSSSWSAPSTD